MFRRSDDRRFGDAVRDMLEAHERRAASTIISAAASRATRPTRCGSCRISRRCSTTTRSSSNCCARSWRAARSAVRRARRARRSAGSTREMTTDGGAFAAVARRRQRGRGRQVLRLGRSGDRRGARRATRARSSRAYGVTRGGQLGRPHYPAPLTPRGSPERGDRAGRSRARSFFRRAKRASGPAATTRCSPTGTGSRSP